MTICSGSRYAFAVEVDPLSESARVCRRLHFLRGWSNEQLKKIFPEIRERAVRMVFEHQREYESEWAAMCSISSKIGCTAETLRKWVRRSETDQGNRCNQIVTLIRAISI